MKKFVLKVLLFFALVVVMDFAWGGVFSWLRSHAKGGSTANCEYIANRCKDDIIILGSSRATHHYVPQIIEDSLGLSCYNCGEEGNGVVLAYGRLLMLTNRYKPKLVLYEITPGYDYGTKEPNSKYLGYLRPYFDKDGISEIFDDFGGELSQIKLISKMYQNTSRLLPNIADNLVFRDNHKGYDPLFGKMDPDAILKTEAPHIDMGFDELKFSYLEKIIRLSKEKEVPLIFIISPEFKLGNSRKNYERAISLSEKYNVPCYNFLEYDSISNDGELFQDKKHLNNEGATKYTSIVISEVLTPFIISQNDFCGFI